MPNTMLRSSNLCPFPSRRLQAHQAATELYNPAPSAMQRLSFQCRDLHELLSLQALCALGSAPMLVGNANVFEPRSCMLCYGAPPAGSKIFCSQND